MCERLQILGDLSLLRVWAAWRSPPRTVTAAVPPGEAGPVRGDRPGHAAPPRSAAHQGPAPQPSSPTRPAPGRDPHPRAVPRRAPAAGAAPEQGPTPWGRPLPAGRRRRPAPPGRASPPPAPWPAAGPPSARPAARIDDEDEDVAEPPVPAGLGSLTASQRALADFLRVDGDLLSVAAETSPALPEVRQDQRALAAHIAGIPVSEKDRLLGLVAADQATRARTELLRWRDHRVLNQRQPRMPR
jgi:hypothetical protein